jgi:dCMP deaminase
MVDRISRDSMLMEMAFIAAKRGTCERASVGAVIARAGRVISTGYVGAPPGASHCTDVGCVIGKHNGCIRTVHAESNAIAYAARYGVSTEDATLYSTHSPCEPCAKLIIAAGIRRVVYTIDYRDRSGLELLSELGIEVEQWS